MVGTEAGFLDLRFCDGAIVNPWRENANLVEAGSEEKEALTQSVMDGRQWADPVSVSEGVAANGAVSQSSSSQNGHEDSVLASRFGFGSVGQVARSEEEKEELHQGRRELHALRG